MKGRVGERWKGGGKRKERKQATVEEEEEEAGRGESRRGRERQGWRREGEQKDVHWLLPGSPPACLPPFLLPTDFIYFT